MTSAQILFHFVELVIAIVISVCIYHQDKFIRFEQFAWRVIKAFFKACYYTIKEKRDAKKKTAEIIPLTTSGYDEYHDCVMQSNVA